MLTLPTFALKGCKAARSEQQTESGRKSFVPTRFRSQSQLSVYMPDSPKPTKAKVAKAKAPAKKKVSAADDAKKKAPAKKPAAKKKNSKFSDESDISSYAGSDVEMNGGDRGEPSPAKQSIEQIYQKKTQLEHILLRPDTYVGSIEPVTQNMWVFDDEKKKMEMRKITFVPGLYKIFDEIIVNACDNKQRDKTMDTLKVKIDAESGEVSVWNNGKGIPVVMHKEHNVYVPELIFGHLLTGSNFDDKKKKTTGGRNGYGAKLANIFSNEFIVETADSNTKQRYKQVFESNMGKKNPPAITSWSKKDFTCITFKPDLARFKMSSLDDDIVALFKKRVYDVAGVTDKSLNVYLNDEKIAIKSFPDYVNLYKDSKKPSNESGSGDEKDTPSSDAVIFDKPVDRWQVGVTLSDDGFQQVSFVNGICTTKGGQHVNYITDQITAKLIAVVKKKNKGDTVKPNYIKNHMTVYVSALIDNPAFDSQIEKSGMVERILSFAQYKQTAELRRKGGGGAKKVRLTGIAKLDDANNAGTSKAQDCTLIVTEGDSAKTIAVGGLSVVGRDYYGVFPLRGKLLNVREASHAQILKNEEIQNIVKILGLKYGQKYESTKSLRYGHLMIMADQDHDGSHIKGLVINFIHHFWPSLLQIDGFIQEFITPIVKCTKGKNNTKVFYTIPEYNVWREATNNGRGWSIKYYKGLGTSTTQEAKEYFSDLKTHQVGFTYDGDEDGDAIDMAFSKKRVEERKDWLRGYQAGTHVDYDVDDMAYSEYVPFAFLVVEIKVAQLAGYVSEHSAYHHGEQSLNGTIINMAQDFVGSNNVHLLSPNGQFGTRLMGGKDAASPRYIFTNLEQVARRIFDPLDNDVLNYLDDDGQSIEPEFYIPIIPMALVNGSEGIGTGWSSSIPNYNPLDIIKNLRQKLNDEDLSPLVPWYRGFSGHIIEKSSGKPSDNQTFLVQGLYEIKDESTLVVSELPVKTWTQTYKQFLESLLESGTIKDFRENHTDAKVLFTITFEPKTLSDICSAPGGVVKKFKLETSISTSNMHLFDATGHIKKYENPHEILNEFYAIRLDYYGRRKASLLRKLEEQIKILSNKTRFILAVVDGSLVVSNRKKQDLLEQLVADGYDQVLAKTAKAKKSGDDEEESDEEEANDATRGYDYLLSMKILSLTKERVEKLRAELQDREQEHSKLEATTIEQLWLADLDQLEAVLIETEEERARIAASVPTPKKGAKGRKPNGKATKKSKKRGDGSDDDSDYEVSKPKAKARAPPKAKAPPKPTATKVEKESKTPAITSFFGTKEPAKEKEKPKPVKKESSDEEIEVLSLAERLARRGQTTPTKTEVPPAKKASKVQKKLVDLASSDEDDQQESDDDVFAMKTGDSKAKKPAAKAKAAPKPRAKSAPKTTAVKDDASSPVQPKASPAPKKQKRAAKGSDEDESDAAEEEKSSSPVAPRRGGRVKARITYTELASGDDEEEHHDSSEFSEAGDDGSDFE
ncbi:DNA topoisomerase 2, partial [Globisporangium splendens]